MEFNFAYNKPNSFFKEKKAILKSELANGLNERLSKDSIVIINKKSNGLKVYFDIYSENGIVMNNVSYEALELIK